MHSHASHKRQHLRRLEGGSGWGGDDVTPLPAPKTFSPTLATYFAAQAPTPTVMQSTFVTSDASGNVTSIATTPTAQVSAPRMTSTFVTSDASGNVTPISQALAEPPPASPEGARFAVTAPSLEETARARAAAPALKPKPAQLATTEASPIAVPDDGPSLARRLLPLGVLAAFIGIALYGRSRKKK